MMTEGVTRFIHRDRRLSDRPDGDAMRRVASTATTKHYGPFPNAFIILPLVSGFSLIL
jgi:hypothetical protein